MFLLRKVPIRMADRLRTLIENYSVSPTAEGAFLIAKAHYDLTLFRAAAKWAAESLRTNETSGAHRLRIDSLRHTSRTHDLETAEHEFGLYLRTTAASTTVATPTVCEAPQETIRRLKPVLDQTPSDAQAALLTLELASAHLKLELFRAAAKLAEQSIAGGLRSAQAFFVAASANARLNKLKRAHELIEEGSFAADEEGGRWRDELCALRHELLHAANASAPLSARDAGDAISGARTDQPAAKPKEKSAWNAKGTWEETDLANWAVANLARRLERVCWQNADTAAGALSIHSSWCYFGCPWRDSEPADARTHNDLSVRKLELIELANATGHCQRVYFQGTHTCARQHTVERPLSFGGSRLFRRWPHLPMT